MLRFCFRSLFPGEAAQQLVAADVAVEAPLDAGFRLQLPW
jgi:hypothetical protein